MSSRHICLVAALLATGGCAPLPSVANKPNTLPPSRLAPDSVVIDLAFVQLPAADVVSYEAVWNAADEQTLTADLRRRLATNGLRIGLFGQQLPTQVRQLLDAPKNVLANVADGSTTDLEIGGSQQRLPLRAGHRSIVKVSRSHPSLSVLLSEDGNVRGHQLSEARCIFALKAYPQGDGRVRLSIVPEIEHGESKTRWAASDGIMVPQTGQERLVLDRLRMEALLNPGQWLVLSATSEIKGLGEYYFAQLTGGVVERRLLLIRLAQTQHDDLFGPGQTSAPLATPGE